MENVDCLPLNDRALIDPEPQVVGETSGGIFVPDNAKKRVQVGRVVAVGPGKVTKSGDIVASDVSVGDRVFYGEYSGTEITVNAIPYLIMPQHDIYAILQDETVVASKTFGEVDLPGKHSK